MGLNHILVDFASDTQDQHFWSSNISSAVFLAFTTVNSFEKRYFVDFLKNLFHLQMEALHCVNDECNFY